MDATPIERIASPAEFAELLAALSREDALPYALAGYAMGRRAQLCACVGQRSTSRLALSSGASSGRRASTKPRAGWCRSSRRCSRCSSASISSKAVRRQGLVCPPQGPGKLPAGSTRLGSRQRAGRSWKKPRLVPITLQESRHTAATWLDAAGVPPKIASVLMGHATPARQPGAAQITLARYTHALPDDMEARTSEAARHTSPSTRRPRLRRAIISFPFPFPRNSMPLFHGRLGAFISRSAKPVWARLAKVERTSWLLPISDRLMPSAEPVNVRLCTARLPPTVRLPVRASDDKRAFSLHMAQALCRTRTDDPFLTMEDQGSNRGLLGPLSPQIADLSDGLDPEKQLARPQDAPTSERRSRALEAGTWTVSTQRNTMCACRPIVSVVSCRCARRSARSSGCVNGPASSVRSTRRSPSATSRRA